MTQDVLLRQFAGVVRLVYNLALEQRRDYATAELHDADILTLDAHFKDLERTVYFEKA